LKEEKCLRRTNFEKKFTHMSRISFLFMIDTCLDSC
jgi:hypothetical protein